jgi:hypothetical protein
LGEGYIEIDEIGYVPIFQTIVQRNQQELPYISIDQAFTCTSMMRPDAFGGASTLITPTTIESTSTYEWLKSKIAILESSKKQEA